ncbi:hypothetical protein ACQE98_08260 [Ornithinimicrobium sp. W1679]|uniref:hypothetical protein n=1 Tax=Ornithinimicrobium sp. W1679 TaxID=3418770 RepID=UPI003CEFAB02
MKNQQRVAPTHVFHRRHNTMPRNPRPSFPAFGRSAGRPVRPVGHPRTSADRAPRHEISVGTAGGPALLLADLTSPWAYLAHLRLGARAAQAAQTSPGADGSHDSHHPDGGPLWWAVRPSTSVPLAGLRTPGPVREELRRQLAEVREVALDGEEIPDDVPAVLPHPRPVAAAYAEGVELGRGPQVLALLLRSYWLEGRDIGDPEVLRRLLPRVLVDDLAPCTGDPRREWGYVVSPAREPLSDGAYHLLERWQQRWVEEGRPGPIALVDRTGARTGPAALQELQPTGVAAAS